MGYPHNSNPARFYDNRLKIFHNCANGQTDRQTDTGGCIISFSEVLIDLYNCFVCDIRSKLTVLLFQSSSRLGQFRNGKLFLLCSVHVA